MSLLTTFFLLAFSLCLIILIFAGRPSPEERTIEARITNIRNPRRVLRYEGGDADLAEGESGTLSERLGHYLKEYPISAKVETLLLQADSESTVGLLLLVCVRFLLVGIGAGALILHSILGGVVGGAVGAVLPVVRLKWKRARRLKAVTAALPDAADLMSRALRGPLRDPGD